MLWWAGVRKERERECNVKGPMEYFSPLSPPVLSTEQADVEQGSYGKHMLTSANP